LASRLRALLAVGDARDAIVPVVAKLDSTKSPRAVQMKIVLVDGRASKVMWTGTITAHYDGALRWRQIRSRRRWPNCSYVHDQNGYAHSWRWHWTVDH